MSNLERPQLLFDRATGVPIALFAAMRVGSEVSRNVSIPLSVPPVDLALGRPAIASSIKASGREAALAVDGVSGTRWGSQYSDAQWLQVDLGTTHRIHAVEIVWEQAFAAKYRIQVSVDGSAWSDLGNNSSGHGGTERIEGLSGSGRYVRLLCDLRGTRYGYSVWRFSVFGT